MRTSQRDHSGEDLALTGTERMTLALNGSMTDENLSATGTKRVMLTLNGAMTGTKRMNQTLDVGHNGY